jgi:hypothetical protein
MNRLFFIALALGFGFVGAMTQKALNGDFGEAFRRGFLIPLGIGKYQRCTFDRNELGPKGDHGQWWWEIYKCEDGTERRELVAGPRG